MLREKRRKTHPGEIKYIVVNWLHSFDPILVSFLVLCLAVVLTVSKDKLALNFFFLVHFQIFLSIYLSIISNFEF